MNFARVLIRDHNSAPPRGFETNCNEMSGGATSFSDVGVLDQEILYCIYFVD